MSLYLLSLNKFICDNRRSLLLSMSGLAALAIFLGLMFAWQSANDESRFATMVLCLGVFACIKTGSMFSSMQSARGRINTLMSPATSCDKFMARWTVYCPLLWGMLLAAFGLSEIVRLATIGIFHPSDPSQWLSMSIVFQHDITITVAAILSTILVNQSFFGFGSILWPKHSVIKTILMLWILGVILLIIVFNIYTRYMPTIHINADYSFGMWLITGGNCFVAAVMWLLAYLRFRESDVVDRLF